AAAGGEVRAREVGEVRDRIEVVGRVGEGVVEALGRRATEKGDGVGAEEGAGGRDAEVGGVLAGEAERRRVGLDEDDAGGAAAEGLEPERARSGEEVENAGALERAAGA